AEDAAAIDLARDEADADEDRHQHAGQFDRGQPEVLDDLDVFAGAELADGNRRAHEQQCERADRVQHAVAHALLEDVPGDQPDAANHAAPSFPSARMNTSSSVV